MNTWHAYRDRLTPEQIAILERSDANPDHPSGDPEKHRVGMIVVAQLYGRHGAGGMN